MPTNTIEQKQDEQSSQTSVNMERIKFMVIHISDTLMLTQMELDVRLNHGK